MQEFLDELKNVFPDEKKIAVYEASFKNLKKANPRKILNLFLENTQPHSKKIVNHDETLITSGELEFLSELNIDKCWDDASEQTKSAIWQYMNTLYVLATTISSIPSNLLSTIEGMAEKCAGEMDLENGQEMPDMATLMAGMQNVLGGMNKK